MFDDTSFTMWLAHPFPFGLKRVVHWLGGVLCALNPLSVLAMSSSDVMDVSVLNAMLWKVVSHFCGFNAN